MAPALDVVLAVGDRISRIVEPEDYGYYPARPLPEDEAPERQPPGEGDPAGETHVIETEGFEARCLLHELDHLDGILFLDRVDSLATDVFRRKRYA